MTCELPFCAGGFPVPGLMLNDLYLLPEAPSVNFSAFHSVDTP